MISPPKLPLLLSVAGLVSSVSARHYDTRFANTTWDDEYWRLQTTTPDPGHYQSRSGLSNGYVGINVASLGPFFEVDVPVNGDNIIGWPLFQRRQSFATVAGFWDVQPLATPEGTNFPWLTQYGEESFISGIPHFSGILLDVGGNVLKADTDVSQIDGFVSTYDFGAGTKSWRYTWTPPDSAPIDVEYTLLTHRLHINQAVTRLKLTPARNINLTVVDVLDGDCAVRSTPQSSGAEKGNNTIWTSVSPNGVAPDVATAYVYSRTVGDPQHRLEFSRLQNASLYAGGNQSSIAQQASLSLLAGDTLVVDKFVGVAAGEEQFKDAQRVARQAAMNASETGFVSLLGSHIKEWQTLMTHDSVDSYRAPNGSLPENNTDLLTQHILAVTSPYYMLQNLVAPNALDITVGNKSYLNSNSIPVGGWVSDVYAGQIFWDVEVWMQPGLVVAYPLISQQIANYRLRLYDQAKENIKTAYQSSKNMTNFSPEAAIFPWTSGRYGNCTSVGPCFDYEYHINGDIGLEIDNYCISSGDRDRCMNEYFPIYQSVAYLYADLVVLNETTGMYELTNATDPDEFANSVTNPAFTMYLIQNHLRMTNAMIQEKGMPVNETWARIAANVAIPFDAEAMITLEYKDMPGNISVKQADVVLIGDLVGEPDNNSLSNLDYYAGKQSQGGPAMTYGVFAIDAATESPSGCSSWTYQRYGTEPYLRGPWFQFSEQLLDDFSVNGGFHPAFPFLTGMGGANEVSVSGYLGYRPEAQQLSVAPSLPPQISHLTYRTLYWQGHAVKAEANSTHTALTRLPARRSLPTADRRYAGANASIPVVDRNTNATTALRFGRTLYLANRRPSDRLTVPGNLAQCQRASSPAGVVPGQVDVSAVDGARSTRWQPANASVPATLTVDLGGAAAGQPARRVCGLYFDWGQAVPASFNVSFSNGTTSDAPSRRVCGQTQVRVSLPLNRTGDPLAITAYASNTTNVSVAAGTWSGRYAVLSVAGNQAYGAAEAATAPGAQVAEFGIIGEEEDGSGCPGGFDSYELCT